VKVIIDVAACQGYACCMMEAPSVFDLNEDEGKVILLQENPSEDLRTQVDTAARTCPAKAIRLENG